MQYAIVFSVLNEHGKDNISKTAIYNCIVYMLWNGSVLRTCFGGLVTQGEAYIEERVRRWYSAQLPMYR